MNFTNEFKETAQYEMSKRLGFKNFVECVQKLGSKEFKRQADKFYVIYHNEVKNKNIPRVSGPYDTKEKSISKISKALKRIDELINLGYDVDKKLLMSESMMSLECMSTAMKLGYIQNIKHRKDPLYRTNIPDNNFQLCAENIVNHNAKNRKLVYLKKTKK